MARRKKQKVTTCRKHYDLRSGVKKVAVVKAAAAPKKRRQASPKKAAKDDLNCSICLDTHRYRAMAPMPCGHSFHKRCINNWVKVSQSCPICRKPVAKKQPASQQYPSEQEPENSDPPRVAVVFAAFVPYATYNRRSFHI